VETESREARGEPPLEETEARVDERRAEVASPARRVVFEQAWLAVAVVLLIVALVFLLRSQTDAAFVTAALGVCAWFLNVRNGLKRKHGLGRQK
jgi:Flp pilus assembly protein TadB